MQKLTLEQFATILIDTAVRHHNLQADDLVVRPVAPPNEFGSTGCWAGSAQPRDLQLVPSHGSEPYEHADGTKEHSREEQPKNNLQSNHSHEWKSFSFQCQALAPDTD